MTTLAKGLEENLPRDVALLPMIASIRVALLLGGEDADGTDDDESLATAKDIVKGALEHWSKNPAEVSDAVLAPCVSKRERWIICCIWL